MQSLSPEARARLAAFQQAQSPDTADEARVLAAIERRVAEPVVMRRRLAVPVIAALALAAGVILAVRWAISPASRSDDGGVQAPYQGAPRIDRAVPEVLPREPIERPIERPVEEVVPAPEVAPPVVDPPVPSVTSPKRPRARPEPDADDIAAEVALLREAKLAAPARRLEILGEHARRFPAGTFAAERSLLEVETRCALGEVDEARRLAARFAEKFAGSPLTARVAKICSEDPQDP